jgi:hypothetical protein
MLHPCSHNAASDNHNAAIIAMVMLIAKIAHLPDVAAWAQTRCNIVNVNPGHKNVYDLLHLVWLHKANCYLRQKLK